MTTPTPNPSTVAATPDAQTTNNTTASRTAETASPETRLPTSGESTGTAGPTRPTFIWHLIDYMWNDPHSRICGFWSPSPANDRLTLITMTGLTLSFFLTVVNQFVLWFSLPLLAAAVAYSMFWLPQIVRSALRGRSAALTTEYLVGTTICRLIFALCLYFGISDFAWADLNPPRLPELR